MKKNKYFKFLPFALIGGVLFGYAQNNLAPKFARYMLYGSTAESTMPVAAIVTDSGATRGESVRDAAGNFHAPLSINGISVRGTVDTGASEVMLNAHDAQFFGLDFSHGIEENYTTANGNVIGRYIIVPQLTVDHVSVNDVKVSCCTTSESLIGMTYLSRVTVGISGSSMTFSK